MKRVAEKVKDIVEIRSFTHLQDFEADPGLTLAGYHFTDITADLMSKWIDRIVAVRPGLGTACALAGFRGVGKSHFLSVLGSIVGRPELRSRISDPHVASTAERLPRRHGHVVSVRRGAGTALIDELKRGVSVVLETNPNLLSDSLYDLLLRASEKGGDVPLVILIDTAMGRENRVARDDGVVLSQIAEAAKSLGIFVAVALDDDISGADGPNASISASFNIDFLDQEHLYRIVDSVIFSKHNQMRGLLHDIYEDYRIELDGFRWSEHRFSSLYPLHPATVEIAPLIRLYIQDFALLGFAAEAGVKILGRPANSLIGLDEVFDSVETRLRAVPALADAFSIFEELDREVVAKLSVTVRHPARLILKGLLVLSLGGEPVSAQEIAASMMIFTGPGGDSAGLDVLALLDSFVEARPRTVTRNSREGLQPRYLLKVSDKADVDNLLSEESEKVPADAVWRVLLGQMAERYSDFDGASRVSQCSVEWRGGIRRGELIWPSKEDPDEQTRERREMPDWTIRVEPDADDATPADENTGFAWRLAKLTAEEKESIGRFHLLQTRADIREKYGDELATSMHVLSLTVEKIWQRIFLQDSYIFAGSLTYKFGEDSTSAHTLAQVLSATLDPIFDSLYPEHPIFSETLGIKQTASVIANFLSTSTEVGSETQSLAETFAVPLGLATKSGDVLIPASADSLAQIAVIRAALADAPTEDVIPLKDLAMRMQACPFGFTREAQHLTLAALVGQRMYDFVTSSGNRINHRSLDLQILWDDIVGVARPLTEQYSAERLLSWAKLITGNSALKSIERTEDRSLIIDSLGQWLRGWVEGRALAEFDSLPDEHLNAGIWRTAANLRKSFGAMAEIIDSQVKGDIGLDQCLQMIADLFSDSESEYENKKVDMRVLREFTAGVQKRAEILTYLTLCENTGDDALEATRLSLLDLIEATKFSAVGKQAEQIVEVWSNFKALYIAYYAERHDAVMKSVEAAEKLKAVVRSDEWVAYETFSTFQWIDQDKFQLGKGLVRELRQLQCSAKVVDELAVRPFCGCSFSLSESERLASLPLDLETIVADSVRSYTSRIVAQRGEILATVQPEAMRSSVSKIIDQLTKSETLAMLTSQELRILRLAVEEVVPSEKLSYESTSSVLNSESEDIDRWEVEVQEVEDFVNTEL